MYISRNAPCPCGSGKKYKRCCYRREQEQTAGHKKETETFEDQALLLEMMNNLRRHMLDGKPHIKKYYRLRKLHSEIVNAMIQYDEDGKFERVCVSAPQGQTSATRDSDSLYLPQSEFDFEDRAGAQAYYDMLIYKSAPNMSCITEDFIRSHRYRREDKIAFLHCMLDSKLGLFEITDTDSNEGFVHLQDVFTKEQFTVTDVALSGNPNYNKNYLYTRLICCDGICFNTGLSLVFSKTEPFIIQHIRHHSKDFNKNTEFMRFIQLYNHYSKSDGRVEVLTNSFK
jgi:hypothetical protein